MQYFRKRTEAFGYAIAGLYSALKKEPHMRFHAVAACFAIAAGLFLQIGPIEWLLISFCIGLVIICELINTAIEKTCDLVSSEFNHSIKYIKDISAGAVLISCLVALFTGSVIFGRALHFF